jgi:hypothetical protein
MWGGIGGVVIQVCAGAVGVKEFQSLMKIEGGSAMQGGRAPPGRRPSRLRKSVRKPRLCGGRHHAIHARTRARVHHGNGCRRRPSRCEKPLACPMSAVGPHCSHSLRRGRAAAHAPKPPLHR